MVYVLKPTNEPNMEELEKPAGNSIPPDLPAVVFVKAGESTLLHHQQRDGKDE